MPSSDEKRFRLVVARVKGAAQCGGEAPPAVPCVFLRGSGSFG